jgi:hypothetical protein
MTTRFALSVPSRLLAVLSVTCALTGLISVFLGAKFIDEARLRLTQDDVVAAATLRSIARVAHELGGALLVAAIVTLLAFVVAAIVDHAVSRDRPAG